MSSLQSSVTARTDMWTHSLLLLWSLVHAARGGNCWSGMRNGRCVELLEERVSKEGCCSSRSPTTAWSEHNLQPGTLFFWQVLGGGVPCVPCKETCDGVECGDGKKCVLRRGRPRCVCACKGRSYRGPVCGTDGVSYRSLCSLTKRACRKPALSLAYYGICQSTCAKILCADGKYCLLDQNSQPHCVKCIRKCDGERRPVCGADGVSYDNPCQLRQAACRTGAAIPIAYRAPCSSSATCSSIRCKEGQSCLRENSGKPRCVTCGYRCHGPRIPVCATDNRTYPSWCHVLRQACATGLVIETKSQGPCPLFSADGDEADMGNAVLEEALL